MDLKGIFKEKIGKITEFAQSVIKKDFVIGLDIGTSSVKIAQFIKKEDGLYLVKADLREIKQSEDSALREQEVVSALKDLFRGIDIKKSKVIVVINCPKTAIKIAKAPYMPKAELRDGISLEAKNYFPFPIDDSLLDYEILGDVVEKGIRKYEVAVSVSPKVTVEKYLLLLEKAGIKPSSFVPSNYALQKVAQNLSTEEKTQCFVDMGKLHTELIICKGRCLLFSRKIPVAGDEFTKAMTGALVSDRGRTELTLDEAEKIKREVGIPSEAESKIIEDKISTTQILSMLRTPLEQLVNEIERCFDYYREESGGGKIDSLVLFGGGASLSGLIKFLSEGLGIEVKLSDSLEGLKIEPNVLGERDKISYRLGLAIGAAQSEGKGINLLPPELKEETKRVIKRGTIEAVFTAIIIIPVLLSIGMNIKIDNFNKRIAAVKMEMASLSEQVKDSQAKRIAQSVLSEEPYWEDVFHELGSLIPDEIRVGNVKVENKVITIKGIVDSPDGQQVLANFIVALEKGLFNGVKLIESKNLTDRPGIEFEISCWIDYER